MLTQNGQIDVKKLPTDNIDLRGVLSPRSISGFGDFSGAASSVPSALAKGFPAANDEASQILGDRVNDPDALKDLFEDEEDEANALGLDAAAAKAKAKSKPKPKRTRLDVVKDEMAKCQSDFRACIESLSNFPEAPTLTELGRLDRAFQRKGREFKENLEYEPSSECQKLLQELDMLRSAMKPAIAYTTGKASTQRKAKGEFYRNMKAVREKMMDVFMKFPKATRTTFDDLHLTTLMEKKDWDQVGDYMSTCDGDDSTIASVDLCERMLALSMKDMDQLSQEQLPEASKEIMDALLVVSNKAASSDTKSDMESIAAVLGATPSSGKSTLEDALGIVMANPAQRCFRVIHESTAGKFLLARATSANTKMVGVRNAQASLAACEEYFKGMFAIECVRTFAQSGVFEGDDGPDPDAGGSSESQSSVTAFNEAMKTFDDKVIVMDNLLSSLALKSKLIWLTTSLDFTFSSSSICKLDSQSSGSQSRICDWKKPVRQCTASFELFLSFDHISTIDIWIWFVWFFCKF